MIDSGGIMNMAEVDSKGAEKFASENFQLQNVKIERSGSDIPVELHSNFLCRNFNKTFNKSTFRNRQQLDKLSIYLCRRYKSGTDVIYLKSFRSKSTIS